jgi:NAD(P)-dependent dehydrogenase (short-subunit alcohol dehydrogenase family)
MPRVLVTGASRGIGKAIALHLAARRWDVLAGVRTDADADRLRVEGGDRVEPVHLDITSAADVDALTRHVAGGLDALVNNAGAPAEGPMEGIDLGRLREAFELNVIGQVAVTQAVLPQLRASRGRVVFISSLNGRISTPLNGAYSATKFAVEAIADAMRVELRPWRIKVSVVEPGPIATDIWSGALDRFDAMADGLPAQQRELYRKNIAGTRRMMAVLQKQAAPAEGVATVVHRALTARRPRARYQVNVAGKVQLAASILTPTRVFDAVMGTTTGARR